MPPLWRPGGPWDDPGAPAATSKVTLASKFRCFAILVGFRVSVLRAFRAPWINKVYLLMVLARFRFLTIFGFEFGGLGFDNQASGREVLQEPTSTEVVFLMIPGFIFHGFE